MAAERMTLEQAEEARGCWIDGHWGQYGPDRLIDIGTGYGFEPQDEQDRMLIEYSSFRLSHIGHRMGDDLDEFEALLRRLMPSVENVLDEEWQVAEMAIELADDVEAWMNENIAPSGYLFGWYDGEFYLWRLSEWEELE